MSIKRALITDIDNTIFDWFAMWYQSFTAMMCEVIEISGVSPGQLMREARAIHQQHGTSEYAFLLESLPSLRAKFGEGEKLRSTMAPAIEAYRLARGRTLQLYPHVLDTLTLLKERGILVIGFSESKLYYSSYRIVQLGLDGLIDRLYCPVDHELPVGYSHSHNLLHTQTIELPARFKKPRAETLHQIIAELDLLPRDCFYVGDSKTKDIRMALDAGVDCAWFSAGADHVKSAVKSYNLLRRVTHWTPEEVEAERAMAENRTELNTSAFHTITTYSQILQFF
ncbi:HAD family hydrolase [Paraburkholderia fungorum]|jgi:FMN phosphatase YigB (HAD superfamily)|uniref:HAD family hydrolase n=1 Tax=Paraburkholderia fungorum TaxID=134537 RepID=UPI000481C2B8|nr:HAD family hydrolase [Paraburkholderia fungorum]MBB5546994.1 phosphoglycolate phosphatase [Paraburkholderia fungorum]PNE55549.1 HAD family hydrolase [Paraburkholderia fungorum]